MTTTGIPRRRWLALIAAPAAVAVWSGWVGLGSMCGFGIIHPLPGIWDAFELNTAITLPVGVEAYGAYALGAWLAPGGPPRARQFAGRSAIGALALGMAGQVIYHLLAAAGDHRAPWPVVTLVSCLPVISLAFGATLAHLMRQEAPAPGSEDPAPAPGSEDPAPAAAAEPGPAPGPVPGAPAVDPAFALAPRPVPLPATGPRPAGKMYGRPSTAADLAAGPGHAELPGGAGDELALVRQAETDFADDLAAGRVPSLRRLKAWGGIGQAKAQRIAAHLAGQTPRHHEGAGVHEPV